MMTSTSLHASLKCKRTHYSCELSINLRGKRARAGDTIVRMTDQEGLPG